MLDKLNPRALRRNLNMISNNNRTRSILEPPPWLSLRQPVHTQFASLSSLDRF